MEKILIVDDDVTLTLMLKTWLTKQGFEVSTAAGVARGEQLLAAEPHALVLTDMRLPDQDGTALLQWMAEHTPTVPAIVMTSYAEIGNAVLSMKLGARDYVAKPINPSELLKKIREALAAPKPEKGERSEKSTAAKRPAPAPQAQPESEEEFIEGRSDASQRLYEYARLVAPTDMSVLINGASGTGKEHIARLIHRLSKRSARPFIAVDCGAIPRDLAASEFFGHVKGSFTGALSDKCGAFEAANGGTLFLDEVGNLSYEVQVQLLRALQERRIRRIGSNSEIVIDIRVIAATNEQLDEAIARGTFRLDLYHRLNEFSLRMPTLREQQSDILLYADFFLDGANRKLDREIVGFDERAAALLAGYDWPGNLRQLKNTVMTATLLARGSYITPADLPAELTDTAARADDSGLLRSPSDEREKILAAIARAGGNKSQAARMLGIDRKTLYNKLRLYGIE